MTARWAEKTQLHVLLEIFLTFIKFPFFRSYLFISDYPFNLNILFLNAIVQLISLIDYME